MLFFSAKCTISVAHDNLSLGPNEDWALWLFIFRFLGEIMSSNRQTEIRQSMNNKNSLVTLVSSFNLWSRSAPKIPMKHCQNSVRHSWINHLMWVTRFKYFIYQFFSYEKKMSHVPHSSQLKYQVTRLNNVLYCCAQTKIWKLRIPFLT